MSAPGRVAARTIGQLTFATSEVTRAMEVIDASGIVDVIEPQLPSGGRPRTLNTRALLVALLLLAHSGQATYLNRVPATLNKLGPSAKRTLGISKTITVRMVEVLFAHVTKALDGSVNYGGRTSERAERDEADARLQAVLDGLLAATLPADDEYQASGDLAFDATLIDANSRPERTRQRKAIKKAIAKAQAAGSATELEQLLLADAALAETLGVGVWGEDPVKREQVMAKVKAGARRASDRDAATIVHKGKLRHAYAVHFAVDVPSLEAVRTQRLREQDEANAQANGVAASAPIPQPVPLVVRRMVVTASTAAPGSTGAGLLEDLAASPVGRRNGWKPADVVADRGYSNADPANWHNRLRAAGYSLIHDLHPDRRGHTATHDGVVILDGQAYSPGILDYPKLVDATPPPIGATRAAIEAYQDVIERRRPFLLPRHQVTAPGQPARLVCPALRGKLACPQRNTLTLTSKGAPEVFTTPATLPLLCASKKAVRIPADVLAHAQDRDLLFGSADWYDAYTRRRPRVEGTNGIVKNPAGPHLAAMRLRVRGRAKVSLLIGFVVAAANLGAVDAWRTRREATKARNDAAAAARRARDGKSNKVRRLSAKRTKSPRAPAA